MRNLHSPSVEISMLWIDALLVHLSRAIVWNGALRLPSDREMVLDMEAGEDNWSFDSENQKYSSDTHRLVTNNKKFQRYLDSTLQDLGQYPRMSGT